MFHLMKPAKANVFKIFYARQAQMELTQKKKPPSE
jgi:hypothetical protein